MSKNNSYMRDKKAIDAFLYAREIKKERTCLKCRQKFISKGNYVCSVCQKQNDITTLYIRDII